MHLAPSDCWFLTGPTASGKTRVGMELARLLGAEIISLDSMSIYRGMDIGTDKPGPEFRREIPHHLIDILDPTEEYSLSTYLQAAETAVAQIEARGKVPLFVGGTPLYLKSLLRGAMTGPPADWEFRREVAEEARRVGSEQLHRRLEQVDPLSAAKLHPNDQRRIIRALEVYKLTGQPISHLQVHFDEGRSAEECRVFVLDWARDQLHQRIDQRVDRMFAAGLVEEVRTLLDRYPALSRTAQQAVGYEEVIAHLAGRTDLAETARRVKVRTRRFAKHQVTWFRSLSECRWISLTQEPDPQQLARQILAQAEQVS